MPIEYFCKACYHTGEAADKYAGRVVKCPSCQAPIEIPAIAIAVPPPSPAPVGDESHHGQSEPPRSRGSFSLKQLMLGVAGIAAGITFLMTLRSNAAAAHYVSLLMLLGLASCAALCRYGKLESRLWRGVAVVACLALVWIWAANDYYVEYWEKKIQGDATRFEDWRHRWSGRLYYRKVNSNTKNGLWFSRGGFSESGKPHGHWYSWVLGPENPPVWALQGYERVGGTTLSKESWFWYGDEITEGEWHLRDK